MRVTSNTYTDLVLSSSQNAQQRLAQLQQQIATGTTIQAPSDDSIAYGQAVRTQASITKLNAYSQAVSQATSMTSQNYQAMSSLHQVVAKAGELVSGVNSTMSSADLQAYGTQMSSLLSQMTSIVNQAPDGNYLFGGSSNQRPLDPSTQAYNASTNSEGTTINVQDGNAVPVGIVAGRSGTPPVDGFLYDSTSGVDVVSAITQARDDLNSGNITALQTTDLPALNKALDHISLYVGSTAANMAAVQTADQSNQQQNVSQQTRLNGLTQTNLPNVTIQLQQVQMQYQASLQAGTRIMGLSMLNYMSSVPNS